ncbi:MAG: hypothetical protein PHC95_04960 [Parabacteroides sp.]|nr:hypothetical protein [Parabacteroides sp.]
MAQGYIIAQENLKILDIFTVSDYSIELDSEFGGKTKITLARKPVFEKGDFIFLKDESGTFFKGKIDTVDNESGANLHELNVIEIEQIFDRKIVLSNEALLSSTGIEDFIAYEIRKEFVSSDDPLLNMSYITVNVKSHTKVYAKVDTDDGGIYNLKTYIGNAREYYGIFLTFTFSGNTLVIDIEKKDQSVFKFDSSVSDVNDYDEVYSVDVLAKLKVVWKIPDTEDNGVVTQVGATSILNYYLLSDRTVSTNVNDPNRATGTIDTIYKEADTLAEVAEEVSKEFMSNSYEHSVTASVRRDSKIYPEDAFYVGHKCEIKTVSHGVKDSMITRISYDQGSDFIAVKFGKMAVTLIEKLRKERSKQ